MGVILSSKTVVEKPQNNTGTTKIIRKAIHRILLYSLLIILVFMCIFPLYSMIVCSTRSISDIFEKLIITPGLKFFDNYKMLMNFAPMFCGFKNSLLTAIPATLISAYLCGLAAFGFAKYIFKGKKLLFAVVIISLIIPQQIAILGLFKVCRELDLIDSLMAVIFPAVANAGIVLFIRYSIQSNVTDSVMDAARIDGCGEFRIYNGIVLPMIIPALATMAVLTFIANWNSLLVPMVVLHSNIKFTLPMWIEILRAPFSHFYNYSYVGLSMSVVPIILLYSLFSKRLIGGLTSGIVKIYQAEWI